MKEIATRIITLGLIFVFLVENSIVSESVVKKNRTEKTKYGEYIYENGSITAVRRKQYGRLAKGIKECKVAAGAYGSSVLVKKSGKKNYVYEIGLKRNSFPTYAVSKNATAYYPLDSFRVVIKDKKNRFFYTGTESCFFIFNHDKEKKCDSSPDFCKNVRILHNIKKIWTDEGGIAYVKDNKLYFAFSKSSVIGCYDDDKAGVHTYFHGKGNQIRKVVSPYYGGPVFVLMKDGSLWGMGDNTKKLISNDETKYWKEFKKMEMEGVKDIDTNGTNVAVITKKGTLWIWGRSLKNKDKYDTHPNKITDNAL